MESRQKKFAPKSYFKLNSNFEIKTKYTPFFPKKYIKLPANQLN